MNSTVAYYSVMRQLDELLINYFARWSGCEVLWWVRLCVFLCACPRGYLRNHTHERSLPNFCACCLWPWRSSPGVVAIRYVLPV